MSAYVHKQIYVRMLSAAIFKVEITQVSINRRMGSKKSGIFMLWNTDSNEKE